MGDDQIPFDFDEAHPKKQFDDDPPEFGTEGYKLSRTTDPDTSKEAGHLVNTTKLEKLVYDIIYLYEERGCITDQVVEDAREFFPEEAWVNLHGTITPRFRPLLNKGLIVDTGERRLGQARRRQRVMVASCFWEKKE